MLLEKDLDQEKENQKRNKERKNKKLWNQKETIKNSKQEWKN